MWYVKCVTCRSGVRKYLGSTVDFYVKCSSWVHSCMCNGGAWTCIEWSPAKVQSQVRGFAVSVSRGPTVNRCYLFTVTAVLHLDFHLLDFGKCWTEFPANLQCVVLFWSGQPCAKHLPKDSIEMPVKLNHSMHFLTLGPCMNTVKCSKDHCMLSIQEAIPSTRGALCLLQKEEGTDGRKT